MLNSLFKPVRSKTKPQQEEDENKKLQETEAGKKNIYVDIRNDEGRCLSYSDEHI